MTRFFSEPTLDDLLEDSMTKRLMRADGVDVPALRAMLLGLASEIDSRPVEHDDRYIPAGVMWASAAAGECVC